MDQITLHLVPKNGEAMTPLSGALQIYDGGCKVFPCKKGEKVPAIVGWQEWAESCTEQKIKDFYASHQCNFGVYCGASNLTVIDLDIKKGKNGIHSFAALQRQHQFNATTLTIKTPSGGLHLYFKGSAKTSSGALGAGIDTRGVGGYVMAPGSVVGDKSYLVTKDAPIIPLPEFLHNALNAEKQKIIDATTGVIEGERNTTLTSLAGTMRSRGMSAEAILAALLVVNDTQLESPLAEGEVKTIVNSVSRYAPEHAKAAADFIDTTAKDIPLGISADSINAAALKKRLWYMKNRYIRGHISVIVSPGGVGKSTLAMLDALSLATAKPLSGYSVDFPCGVWIYNTEDPIDELERRLVALTKHHDIPLNSLKNVFITSGQDSPLVMAKRAKSGIVVNQNAIDRMSAFIGENNVRVLIVDPFVRTHECNENDNMEIDRVIQCFQAITKQTGCAIGLIHHTRKPGSNGSAVNVDWARGASSLVSAARVAHTLQTMSEGEARRFGVPENEHGWYMRLDNAKANLHPPADGAAWFKKVNISLDNGDDVGSIERIDLQDISYDLKQAEFKAECTDIALALSRHMQPGDSLAVPDAYLMIAGANPHIFSVSEKRGREKLIGACSVDCAYGGKRFVHEYLEGPKKTARHWIKCEASSLAGLDFLD